MRRTVTVGAACAFVLSAAVAGCGSGNSAATSATSPAVTPTSSASPAPVTASPTPSISPTPSTSVEATQTTHSAQPTATTTCGWKRTTTYRHVIWLWMENRTYTSVLGSGGGAPHLSSYAARCGLATNYYAITHPSLPNYLAATSGSTGGVSSDCDPNSCPQGRSSLFGQVHAAGGQWRGYAESMPSACGLAISGSYAPKHNPAVYFTPVRSSCHTWDVPMGGSTGAFATALAHRTLPSFAFVTPNLCNDGHDCHLSTADSWLGTWLGRITTSPAYRAGDTLLFVTWDEGVGSDQHIATVVIGPTVPRGLRVSTRFTHYSLLRTTEDLLHLGRLGAAASATSMRSAFHL